MDPTRRLDWQDDVVAVRSGSANSNGGNIDDDDDDDGGVSFISGGHIQQQQQQQQQQHGGYVYVADDTTAASPVGPHRRRVAVLPSQLLRGSGAVDLTAAAGGGGTAAQGCSPGAGAGGGGAAAGRRLPCLLLRLPHPRHGRPCLFLCATAAEPPQTAGGSTPLNALLYEVQLQGPPGGYAQTWFLQYSSRARGGGGAAAVEEVLPCDRVMVGTPIHLSFFALSALVQQAASSPQQPGRFVPAEELFASPTAAAPSARDDDAGDDEGDAYAIGGKRPRPSSTGAIGGGSSSPPPSWEGWAAAAAAVPALAPVWRALQSRRCLEPLCEVREVGGTAYYRFSQERAVRWLAARVEAVRRCGALHRLLQLDTIGGGSAAAAAAVAPENVPVAVVVSLVAEYAPESLSAALLEACGGGTPSETATAVTGATAAPSQPATAAAGSASVGEKGPPAPSLKSAAVRRLEKAGRPKGTPTLFSMFAKMAPSPPSSSGQK